MTKIEEKFKGPESGYRSAPFWSWNDALNDKYLQHQLDEMKEGGMAGGFIHSRVGLLTPYLSKEWMRCVRNTVRYASLRSAKGSRVQGFKLPPEHLKVNLLKFRYSKYAKRISIPIYLYDEDRWPSGFAGGLVTRNKKHLCRAWFMGLLQEHCEIIGF